MEINDAKEAGKPIFLVTPRNVQRYREHANRILEYEALDDLCSQLRTYDLSLIAQARS